MANTAHVALLLVSFPAAGAFAALGGAVCTESLIVIRHAEDATCIQKDPPPASFDECTEWKDGTPPSPTGKLESWNQAICNSTDNQAPRYGLTIKGEDRAHLIRKWYAASAAECSPQHFRAPGRSLSSAPPRSQARDMGVDQNSLRRD